MKHQKTISASLILLFAAACSSGSDPTISQPDNLLTGSCTVDSGYSVPIDGEIGLFWEVSSGSPDYSYVTLGNFINDRGFSLPLPETLQEEAINSYGVAIGFVGAFAPGTGLSAGRQDRDAEFDGLIFGFADNFAIIYQSSIKSLMPMMKSLDGVGSFLWDTVVAAVYSQKRPSIRSYPLTVVS